MGREVCSADGGGNGRRPGGRAVVPRTDISPEKGVLEQAWPRAGTMQSDSRSSVLEAPEGGRKEQ